MVLGYRAPCLMRFTVKKVLTVNVPGGIGLRKELMLDTAPAGQDIRPGD
jgi:hypothetical protein